MYVFFFKLYLSKIIRNLETNISLKERIFVTSLYKLDIPIFHQKYFGFELE